MDKRRVGLGNFINTYKSIKRNNSCQANRMNHMTSVLYVDDDQALLELVKLYLEKSKTMKIDVVESVAEAQEKIRTTRYDAIISDYQMPETDGITFLKELRREYPMLPFIIFTGKGREDVVIEALNFGADHYIQKGGDPRSMFAELKHHIERAVERKRANESILHLNRLHAVMSSTNRAIIHIRERQPLLDEACRIAVEEGKFLMAWIGMLDRSKNEVLPVAACFNDEGNFTVGVERVPEGMVMSDVSIREGRTLIVNDIASEPGMSHFHDESPKRGCHSSAAIPLWRNKEIIGAMWFYSSDVNFFNENEIMLLEDLVTDIGFGLEIMEGGKSRG